MRFLHTVALFLGLIICSDAIAEQSAVVAPTKIEASSAYNRVVQRENRRGLWYLPWDLVDPQTSTNLLRLTQDNEIALSVRQVYLRRDRDSVRSIQQGLESLALGGSLVLSMQSGTLLAKAHIDRALDFADRKPNIQAQTNILNWENTNKIFSVEYGQNPVRFENVVCYVATQTWYSLDFRRTGTLDPLTDNFVNFGLPSYHEERPYPLCHTVIANGVTNPNSNNPQYVDDVRFSFYAIDGFKVSNLYQGDLLRISGLVYRATPSADLAVRLDKVELMGEEVVFPAQGGYLAEWK
jgi:hypothetical protein